MDSIMREAELVLSHDEFMNLCTILGYICNTSGSNTYLHYSKVQIHKTETKEVTVHINNTNWLNESNIINKKSKKNISYSKFKQ